MKDDLVILSGKSWTVTLPTAPPLEEYKWRRKGDSLIVTIKKLPWYKKLWRLVFKKKYTVIMPRPIGENDMWNEPTK